MDNTSRSMCIRMSMSMSISESRSRNRIMSRSRAGPEKKQIREKFSLSSLKGAGSSLLLPSVQRHHSRALFRILFPFCAEIPVAAVVVVAARTLAARDCKLSGLARCDTLHLATSFPP